MATERSDVTLIGGRPARYRLRRSDRARRVILQVTSDHGLVVTLPRRASLADAVQALREHEAWLDRQLARYDVREGPRRRALATGSAVLFLGVPRRLELAPLPDGRRRARWELRDGALRGALAPADLLDPRTALERWLRVQARVWIEARVAEFAPEVGVEPAGVIVGERRTRWGSCSPRGVLSFCYRLIMAPPPAIDAIVLHELCHLVHLDHSPRFHAVLERHCPDHRRHRAWLRAHESELRL